MDEDICILEFPLSISLATRPSPREYHSGDIKMDLNLPRTKEKWSRPAYRDDKT
jgi:hypothetical protein